MKTKNLKRKQKRQPGGSLEPGGSAIRIGQFRVSNLGAGKCWIANGGGEGMETSETKLAKHICTYFKREY